MNVQTIQADLFKTLSSLSRIDITTSEGFDGFHSLLESIYNHTKLINYSAAEQIREMIDSMWEKYREKIKEVPQREIGDNPKEYERETVITIKEIRIEYVENMISAVTDVLAARCVIA